MKIVEDLARYRHIIEITKPTCLIECGTWRGGSARWFANLIERVITIDIQPRTAFEEPNILLLVGGSTEAKQVRKARELSRGYRTMVVLDSDHSVAHVAKEIDLYAPLVSDGCYLVVEDAIVDEIEPGTGPGAAIQSRLVGNPRWVEDTEVDDMYPVTMHPRGWWRRSSSGVPLPRESSDH